MINLLKTSWFEIIKKTILIILLIILVLYIGLVIYRIPAAFERYDTKKTVDDIHNQKLKLEDVMRKELPPEPDEKLNNSTLNGIDTNNNGIRDDVEIAIFKLYPDSARIRSGALQYAKAMQMHFRKDIVNSKTFVAVLQEKSRGYLCLGSEPNLRNIKDEKIFKKLSDEIDIRLEKIYDLVFNIDIRKNKEEENYEKYMTSMGIEPGQYCDIDINLLN